MNHNHDIIQGPHQHHHYMQTTQDEMLKRIEDMLRDMMNGLGGAYLRISNMLDRMDHIDQRMAGIEKALAAPQVQSEPSKPERPAFPSNALNHSKGW